MFLIVADDCLELGICVEELELGTILGQLCLQHPRLRGFHIHQGRTPFALQDHGWALLYFNTFTRIDLMAAGALISTCDHLPALERAVALGDGV